MFNQNLHEKAIEAAKRFLERKGYDVDAVSWIPEGNEGCIDLIAHDEDNIVFIDVTAKSGTDEEMDHGHTERGKFELLAAKWLSEHSPEGDVSVRFDTIDMLVVSADRALLRHHISAFSEA